jgi:uncharacterized protein (TIGR02996 family)
VARFERDGEYVEAWVVKTGNDDDGPAPWDYELFTRRGDVGTDDSVPEVKQVDRERGHAAYRLFQRACLAGGWRRVRDPEREADVAEPIDPSLDAALRDDPDDDAALSVYADFLQQRGHPRGTLIALQLAGRVAEADKLIEAERDVLLGPLRTAIERKHPRLKITWARGFLDTATLTGRDGYMTGDGEAEQLVWDLLRHPSARLLRQLVVGCYPYASTECQLVVEVLLAAARHPLRRLVLVDYEHGSIPRIGDLSGIGSVFPHLEDLELTADNDLELGELSLPRCKRFVLYTHNLRRETLHAILDARWPALHELELTFGQTTTCTEADLALLLDGSADLPQLRVLRLHIASLTNALCEGLTESPLLQRLDVLELDRCRFSSTAYETLRQAMPRLQISY